MTARLPTGERLAAADHQPGIWRDRRIWIMAAYGLVAGLPLPLYWLGRLMPVTHMIEIMRGVVLREATEQEEEQPQKELPKQEARRTSSSRR